MADLGAGDDLHLAAAHPDPQRELDVLTAPDLLRVGDLSLAHSLRTARPRFRLLARLAQVLRLGNI